MSLKKILIVDADRETSEQIASACRDFNYRVGVLTEAAGLLDELAENPPDLMIINVELPDQNGFVLCKEIRSRKELQNLPVILTSHKADAKVFEKHRKLKDAAHAYFHKPIVIDDLIDEIEQLIGLPPPPSTTKSDRDAQELLQQITDLQSEIERQKQETKMFRESYENVSTKLERAQHEVKNLEEALQKSEEQISTQGREQLIELEKWEAKKSQELQSLREELAELEKVNANLQEQLGSGETHKEDLRKQVEAIERRARLSEEENHKREGDLKARIKDLLAQVDEAKESAQRLEAELEEMKLRQDEEREKWKSDLETIEQERIKMEQRVIKAYKKIKMDQLRDEKLKKALEVARTLLENQ